MKIKTTKNTLQLLYTLIDLLPDFVYIKDAQSRFLLANQSLVRSFGLEHQHQLIGKSDFDFHPPELAQQYYADEQALLKSRQPLINRVEPILDQSTGEMRWLLTTKIPFYDRRGQIAGFIGLNRDITERKQAEETLKRLTDERTAELENLQRIMQQIIIVAEKLGNTSATMTQTSTQMASRTTQVSHQGAIISANSQDIHQHITVFSAAIHEFATTIRELSQSVNNIMGMITNAVNLANTSSLAITGLKSHSQDIGNMSKMITSISQQTKFLALNAHIEAARVAEAGQGFRVVADEIKSLARDTAAAAEDITRKITTIQTSSHETAAAITELVKIIQQVSEFSHNVAASMTEQAQTTDSLSVTIAQTTQGSTEITQAITEVASATEQSAQQAATVQQEAEELAGLAHQLRELVKQFEVGSVE